MKALTNQKTDMLCKPWYVGNLPYHIPNNTDITVDYKGGNVVVKQPCFEITGATDQPIRQTRALGEEVPPERLEQQRTERDKDDMTTEGFDA